MSTNPPINSLSHLSSVSAEGLRLRASIWLEKGHHDPEDAVKTALLAAANDLDSSEQTFSTLAAADLATLRDDRKAIIAIIDGTFATCIPDGLRAIAATLRAQGIPDDGGSTAAHLESASERILADAKRLQEIRSVATLTPFDAERIQEIALGTLNPEPPHDVTRMRM